MHRIVIAALAFTSIATAQAAPTTSTTDTAKLRAEISEAGFDVTQVETSNESLATNRRRRFVLR